MGDGPPCFSDTLAVRHVQVAFERPYRFFERRLAHVKESDCAASSEANAVPTTTLPVVPTAAGASDCA